MEIEELYNYTDAPTLLVEFRLRHVISFTSKKSYDPFFYFPYKEYPSFMILGELVWIRQQFLTYDETLIFCIDNFGVKGQKYFYRIVKHYGLLDIYQITYFRERHEQ